MWNNVLMNLFFWMMPRAASTRARSMVVGARPAILLVHLPCQLAVQLPTRAPCDVIWRHRSMYVAQRYYSSNVLCDCSYFYRRVACLWKSVLMHRAILFWLWIRMIVIVWFELETSRCELGGSRWPLAEVMRLRWNYVKICALPVFVDEWTQM